MKILAIAGSNRKKSLNKMLVRAIKELALEDMDIEIFEIDEIPFFNQDLEANLPVEVLSYISKVKDADAIIIATPEYNNMIPGILKNAIEWLTRDYSSDAVKNKPLAITGASTGGFGAVRAQNQLLLLAQITKFKTHSTLRLPISKAQEIFNDEGNLIDSQTKEKLQKFLYDFKIFIETGEL